MIIILGVRHASFVCGAVVLLGMGLARWGITRIAQKDLPKTAVVDAHHNDVVSSAEQVAMPLGE